MNLSHLETLQPDYENRVNHAELNHFLFDWICRQANEIEICVILFH